MSEIDPKAFYTLGKLLVSDQYINNYDNLYSPLRTNTEIQEIKQIQENKVYIDKLQTQLNDLEKTKTQLVSEYDELLKQQKVLDDNVQWLNKKLIINKKYNNSANNFVITHNQRLHKKIIEKTQQYAQNSTKINKLSLEIKHIDVIMRKITNTIRS